MQSFNGTKLFLYEHGVDIINSFAMFLALIFLLFTGLYIKQKMKSWYDVLDVYSKKENDQD